LLHDTGPGFPERPERLKAIVERVRDLPGLVRLAPKPAPLEWITTIHTPAYVERVKGAWAAGARHLDTTDVPISEKSYDAAVLAAGALLVAVDAVMERRVKNAFCAVRPPGHHALKDRAMGFCLFNNVAVAARYVQKKHKLARVLIVDWDVHHGNATQDAFFDDPTVMYFSVHRSPFYPGTGHEHEKGKANNIINATFPAGTGDEPVRKAFEEKLKPAATAFKPEFVFISCGFDAYKDDPLGGMRYTAPGYAELTRIVREIADASAQGRIVSALEGGYNLEGLADCAEAHLKELMK
jgi:acetoin utilization deacetylase AcuC-like enzyme